MYEGIVKTRDILLHPWPIIHMRGAKGYFKILVRALSRRRYRMVDHLEKTGWINLRELKK